MNAPLISLPAPHGAIKCRAEAFPWGYYIEYLAPNIDALLAAGCITEKIHGDLLKPARRRKLRMMMRTATKSTVSFGPSSHSPTVAASLATSTPAKEHLRCRVFAKP